MSEKKQDLYMLFAPKSARGLRVDYPELNEYPEFQGLRANEMLFVWWYACKSSPYYDIDKKTEREIIAMCLEKARMRFDDPAKKEKFLSQNFPEKINAAITTMRTFEPSVRILGRLSAIRSLSNIRKLTSLELDEHGNHPMFIKGKGEDAEVDFKKRTDYMNMIIKKEEKIGSIIDKAERGYGVAKMTDEQSKDLDDGNLTFLESYHENH